MPVTEWHGGNVHVIRPSVLHLIRGQVFEIDEKSVFTFGGARSHDIDHLLDPADPDFKVKSKRLDRDGLFYRVVGQTWWAREMPDPEEMEEGRRNLAVHGNHECQRILRRLMLKDPTVKYTCSEFTSRQKRRYTLYRMCRPYHKRFCILYASVYLLLLNERDRLRACPDL